MLKPYPFAFLRVPAQSISQVNSIPENLNSFFEEGLYLSSPVLWSELNKKGKLTEKESAKLTISLYKYWIRSCMRCTPYGTFAGVTTVNILSDSTNIKIEDSSAHHRMIKLNSSLVYEIVNKLSALPEIKNQSHFFTNNSLYQLSETYRYAEYVDDGHQKEYQISSIEKSEFLDAILESSKDGATIQTLITIILSLVDATESEAISFVDQLIESQLIISGIEPALTGEEPLEQLIKNLSSFNGIDDIIQHLNDLNICIKNPVSGIEGYKRINKIVSQLPWNIKSTPSNIHVDLYIKTISCQIENALIKKIIAQAEELMIFSQPNKNSELKQFADYFKLKFDQEEIPLSIALDPDLGLGYSAISDDASGNSDLVNDLILTNSLGNDTIALDQIQNFVLSKYIEFLEKKETQIEISEIDINRFKQINRNENFPNSLFLLGTLVKKNGLLDSHSFTFDLTAFTGPSSVNLMGRFTNNNKTIDGFVKQSLQDTDLRNDDVIYAEIVHLPQTRLGNILSRSVLRKYEIPYVGKSNTPKEFQIEVNDLLVSVVKSEVILRSKRLKKRVIPTLSTAHNFNFKSLPIYKFLCDLQFQHLAFPNIWNWGYLKNKSRLPRVIYKDLILKKAEWKLNELDLKDIPVKKYEYCNYFKIIIDKFDLPQKVVYCEGDNKLLIDLHIQFCLETLVHFIRKNKVVVLEEYLVNENNCIVSDITNAPFTNELIIPLYFEKQIETGNVSDIENLLISDKNRKFGPSTEWLYFKIYCGTKTAEILLQTVISNFVLDGLRKEKFEKFFFIKYRDEFSHLRIRFFNSQLSKQSIVQEEFLQLIRPFLDNGLINKVSIDTYIREIERYRSDLIVESEDIFFNDSICVLKLLNSGKLINDINFRLYVALRGIDIFLDDFNLTLTEKSELLNMMKNSFFKEFGGHPKLQKQLNERYRSSQKSIFGYMNKELDQINHIENIISIFSDRSTSDFPIINSILLKKEQVGKNIVFNLLPSYIHMFINRLFISQQRKYELVIYYFLDKYYNSTIAMSKNQNP